MMKPTRLFRALMLASAALLLASPLAANTLEGQIDGEARSWYVLQSRDASTASFQEIMPGLLNYTIQGHATERFSTEGTISLQFTEMQGQVQPPEVTYFPFPRMRPHYGEAELGDWTLDVQDNADGSKQLSGHVQAELTLVGEADGTPERITVKIHFDVAALSS